MKTKTKTTKRLSLNRETLANLTDETLARVNGGAGSILIRCGVTVSCPGVCPSKGDDECGTIIKQ